MRLARALELIHNFIVPPNLIERVGPAGESLLGNVNAMENRTPISSTYERPP